MISKTTTKESGYSLLELKLIVTLLIILAIGLGFFLGTIHAKIAFDFSAINSGHAQYNTITGKIEWKRLNTCMKNS